MIDLEKIIQEQYGVSLDVFIEALHHSPSAQGYIAGAISELILGRLLEQKGFEVIRIKEKPAGGNDAKNEEARGDFYIRGQGASDDKWLVIESKGLKSNSEFRGAKLDSKKKVFRFLKPYAFPTADATEVIYRHGEEKYQRTKAVWESQHKGKQFPPFRWRKEYPGPDSCSLAGLWESEEDLWNWIDSQPEATFQEKAYRAVEGPIAILETHKPSKRICPDTGISQAAPLVQDFNILAVDLYLRTGKHEFAFANAEELSHSPTSPGHLYQNYTIDIVVKGKKPKVILTPPWYADINKCIAATSPTYRTIDRSQIENRF